MIGYFGLLIKFIESEVGTCSSYMLQFLIVVHVSRISVAELHVNVMILLCDHFLMVHFIMYGLWNVLVIPAWFVDFFLFNKLFPDLKKKNKCRHFFEKPSYY